MKAQIKGHLYWSQDYKGEVVYRFSEYDMRTWDEDSRDGRVWLKEFSTEVEVPENFDPRPELVASLRAEKKRVQAQFTAKVAEIDQRINKLLALEMA